MEFNKYKPGFIDVQLFAEGDGGGDGDGGKPKTEPTTEPTNDYEAMYRALKASFDRTSKELADEKRAKREKMNAEEKEKADREAELKMFEEIKRENVLIKTKSEIGKFVADEKTLDAITKLFVDGENTEALRNLGAYIKKEQESLRKQIEQELLTKNPTPPAGGESDTTPKYKKDDLAKLSYQEVQRIKREYPDLYKKITS